MSPKKPTTSHRPVTATTPNTGTASPAEERVEREVKALTINVPVEVLHKAKTRAALEGTTMSAVVTNALAIYADGLRDTLGQLGFTEKK